MTNILIAGAAGDLGYRISTALVRRGAAVSALIRKGSPPDRLAKIRSIGATPVEIDFEDATALREVCHGAGCVVSALNGLEPTIIGAQGRLLDAAVAAGVPRFMPSDFSLDFTKTRPGDNRNMDLRRTFMARVDAAPIRATSILNGAFGELLTGEAPIVLHKLRRILCWGDPDQLLDFTTKDDVADYAADAALDGQAPRFLRIAGDVVSPNDLAALMSRLNGRRWRTLRPGGLGLLGGLIRITRALSPATDVPFPAWQGMQYIRDMSSGRGKLTPLDNDRYGKAAWTRVADILALTI
ncbi:NmrA family NAD(P)-binding protein [Asaia lannensis]|uniref:NmrA family NAD(P)-binding protein n=1 Tax=Asaia lannensis NBRC 102526 TaxID=1307926 RepID=A0ABT1CCC5_9PROT|nr:NmrA family NAD(P)-binding protein [Asaia lannensis]MCO6158513.1 NmrA family NAD(P)-binding protein [Asaia lannensis NBRC 102526]GBR00989.1 hypothetical cytosolic protein [Asaia lannensis NBRC 102526]